MSEVTKTLVGLYQTMQNIRVSVLDSDGKPLMPTTASRARRWLDSGKAKSFWSVLGVWGVQLLVEPSGRDTQPIAIGLDPGKRYSGVAVQSEKFTLSMFHLVLMGFMPKQGTAIAGVNEKMNYRRMLRRGRRGRRIDRKTVFKLRNHRQKRFNNRKQAKLAPSILSNKLLELRVIRELCKLYPISTIVVEKVRADVDPTSGRKGAKSGKGFSPVMVGQAFLFAELKKLAPAIKREGWQKDGNGTSQIRKYLGLIKEKQDKAKQIPQTHAVDAIALASMPFVQYKPFHTANSHGHQWSGSVCITPALFKVISKPRITRRRLHDAVPASCGVRERYGGSTTPFEARKGDLIEYKTKSKGETKIVIGYCSGYTGNNLSLSHANWSRLGRFANSRCRILARNTGLVISGASNPLMTAQFPHTTKPIGYGRSTSEV